MKPAAFCRRCLVQDLPCEKTQYYQEVLLYRKSLPVDIAADDELYENRLNVCLECDELINGVCDQCGWYVQKRAAHKKNKCPNPAGDLWNTK